MTRAREDSVSEEERKKNKVGFTACTSFCMSAKTGHNFRLIIHVNKIMSSRRIIWTIELANIKIKRTFGFGSSPPKAEINKLILDAIHKRLSSH